MAVKLFASGIAARSGLLGFWPMSPAAKPANPAPSLKRSSRCDAGTSFADGRACRSTNCANRTSLPSSSTRRRTSATVDGCSTSMTREAALNPTPPFLTVTDSRLSPAERDHADRPRPRYPVLSLEIEPGHRLDPGQPLAERDRVAAHGPRS